MKTQTEEKIKCKYRIKFYNPNTKKWEFWAASDKDKGFLLKWFKSQPSVKRGIISKYKVIYNGK